MRLNLLDRVEVFNFGRHPGVVAEFDPEVEIQGRKAVRSGWIKVRLDDGRIWNGAPDLVAFRAKGPTQALPFA